jgi:hypothetical protein
MEILIRLQAEGLPVTIFSHEDKDFQQCLVMTSLVRHIAATGQYDYIVALDADEFIRPLAGSFADSLNASLPKSGCGYLRWETYVPISEHYHEIDAPLFHNFRKRPHETCDNFKVVVSNTIGLSGVIGEGNHIVGFEGNVVPCTPIKAVLQHAPARSPDQIIAKALLGNHRLSIKKRRGHLEGVHWDDIAMQIRTNDYRLALSELQSIALSYPDANLTTRWSENYQWEDDRIGTAEDKMVYRTLSKPNVVKRFDTFARHLCEEHKKNVA